MIRSPAILILRLSCKPRASGDDPDLLEVIMGMDE